MAVNNEVERKWLEAAVAYHMVFYRHLLMQPQESHECTSI
jgi:hypothetical protein